MSKSEARAVVLVVFAAAAATAAAIVATRLLQAPPARDLAIMATTLAATAGGSILVALLVRRFAHHLSFSAQLVVFAAVALVLATTNTPDDRLTKELSGAGLEVKTIGDAVAARSASMAFYEARKLALAL